MKEDSEKFRLWKQKKDKEVLQLKEKVSVGLDLNQSISLVKFAEGVCDHLVIYLFSYLFINKIFRNLSVFGHISGS